MNERMVENLKESLLHDSNSDSYNRLLEDVLYTELSNLSDNEKNLKIKQIVEMFLKGDKT